MYVCTVPCTHTYYMYKYVVHTCGMYTTVQDNRKLNQSLSLQVARGIIHT